MVDQPGNAPGPAACKAAVLSFDTPGPSLENWHAALVPPQARWVLETLPHKLVRGVLRFRKSGKAAVSLSSKSCQRPKALESPGRRRGPGLHVDSFKVGFWRGRRSRSGGGGNGAASGGSRFPTFLAVASDDGRTTLFLENGKERTPLPHSLERQPQVFTTDVSVFGRHTSRGKPLVYRVKVCCSFQFEPEICVEISIYRNPPDKPRGAARLS